MSDPIYCPYCGGKGEFEKDGASIMPCGSARIDFQIRCSKCGASLPTAGGYVEIMLRNDGVIEVIHDDRDKATKNWNRRVIR